MINIVPKNRFKSIQEFQFIKDRQIGCGSFGVVRLARHRNTTRTYAVKVITLNNIPSETELKLFQREIAIHTQVDHPHIIKLWDTLLEDGQIYMIMEYAQNGNLFYHQNTKTIFSEIQAFRFFTQTLQGVSYLHENDIIHRDLKPENLLLDCYQNIKICDLGWAAHDIHLKRSTFCGTYEYMAPQMLFKTQYDHHVDIWALGILLYELLHGYAPFKGKSANQVQQSVLEGGYELNPKLSQSVRDLIVNILQVSVTKRLTIRQIFDHPWVKEMENHINDHLKLQNIQLPKQIAMKIAKIPPASSSSRPKKEVQHCKNSSMNITNPSQNSEPYQSTVNKSKKNVYHSLEKQNQNYTPITPAPAQSPKEVFTASNTGLLKKNKMFMTVKTQMNQFGLYKSTEKYRGKKSIKSKDFPSFQKNSSATEISLFRETTNRKKPKYAKSQVEMLAEKYPIRYQTEANDNDYEPTKLKKSHLNTKNLAYSRSALKMNKSRI